MARRVRVTSALLWAFGISGVACKGPDVQINALPDGTRELKCRHTLPQCLDHVEELCKGASYEVLYATDTQKVYGSPSYNEVESRTSEAVIHCLGLHQKPMGAPPAVAPGPTLAAAPSASTTAATPAVKAPVATTSAVAATATAAPVARACVPGATQACVGAGACAGGQACLADGSAFGACDCGGVKSSP